MFLQTLAAEEPEVSIVLYDPGVVDTDMQKSIRSANKEQFSQVETFQKYHREQQLNSPEAVAADICQRYIQKWCVKNLRERYADHI